jgi:hypothetical protein
MPNCNAESGPWARESTDTQAGNRPVTLLQYFTPTPHVIDVPLASRIVRVESNSSALIDCFERAFRGLPAPPPTTPRFLWRLVCENSVSSQPSAPAGFSDGGLCFVNFGQQGFIAADASRAQGVGFFPENWLNHQHGFTGDFLSLLLTMTAPCLGLTPMRAGCVALEGKAVLIFRSVTFSAPRLGDDVGGTRLRPCSDGLTLVEPHETGLRAWGGLGGTWSCTAKNSDELVESSAVADGGNGSEASWGRESSLRIDSLPCGAIPVMCVVVDGAMKPGELMRVSRQTFAEILADSFAEAGDRDEALFSTVVDMLIELPAYRMAEYESSDGLALLSKWVRKGGIPEGPI